MSSDDNELVTIYNAKNELDNDFFKAYLTDYGFDVADLSNTRIVGTELTYPTMRYVLQVPQGQAERAAKFVEDLRNAVVDDSEIK